MLQLLKQLQIDKRIKAGYGVAFALLLLSYLFTLYANRQLIEQTKVIISTNNIIINLEDVGLYVRDAESSIRGYLLLKNKIFLESYQSSLKKTDSSFLHLSSEYTEANLNQGDINKLKSLVSNKFKNLEDGLQISRTQNASKTDTSINTPGTFLTTNDNNKLLTDSITKQIKMLQVNKTNLLAQKTSSLNKQYSAMNLFIIISLLLVSIFAFFGFLTYMRENTARKNADKKVIEFQTQLQLRIEDLDAANKELVEMRRLEKFAATGRMARSIAHEVRNPLTNIDLAIGQIKAEMPEVDQNFDMLFNMVNRNSKRINQLITELLNATRFVELNYLPVSINSVIDEALELAKDRITLNHIEIKKNYTHDICEIAIDAEKVKIAFLNIIVNAVESLTDTGGIITINTIQEGDKCVVKIIDNGVGMDETALSKLFEPYFTTKLKGNGLGLTNTQNIILNHKASINVESLIGKGTSFTIKF